MTVEMGELLDTVDDLAARRPVAARVVAMTDDDGVGSAELAKVLMGDATLSARVMRLANSAYYGLGGRVRSVSFAITVVGFSTIRSMAAVAAAGADDDAGLPEDFWAWSKAAAVTSGELGSSFGLPAGDAFCLGLLSSIGQAILCQHDPDGYRAVLAREDVTGLGRQALLAAETEQYGFAHTQVSAAALSAWAFPRELAEALHQVDQPGPPPSPWVACLRTAVEVASRVLDPSLPTRPLADVSGGAVHEERLVALLPRIQDGIADSSW